jgi:ribosome recycling factor
MNPQEISKATEQKMVKSLESLQLAYTKIRTGRAHSGLLEHIQVDYYGTPTSLSQVASLTLVDSRTIGVTPWEKKMVAVVEKAIRESGRRELTKLVRSEAEDAKIAVRNIRRDAIEQFKKLTKDKLISEDDERRGHEDTQKLTDRFVADIDKLSSQKEAEVMTV